MAATTGGQDDRGAPAVEVVAADVTRVTQAPSDVLRLAVGLVALVAVTLVGALFGGAVVEFTAGLLRGLDEMPDWLMGAVAVVAQVGAVGLAVLAVAAAVHTRSGRLLVATGVAAAVAAGLTGLLTSMVDERGAQATELQPIGALGEANTWSAWVLAGLAAVVSTVSPWVPRRWRRAGWTAVVCIAVAHFATTPVAFHTIIAVLVGWTVGTAITVVAGSPSHRPSGTAIAVGLAAVGVPLTRLEQADVDARGSTPYFGVTADGRKLFVKALGNDERSADLMFRIYRRIQPHDLGDEKAFSTLRRAVEHEALVALAARDLGVRTPRLVAFAAAEPSGFVLAYEAIAGRSLDRLTPEEMTDAVLDEVWAQLALLRRHRTAHRDLRLANVFLAEDGEAWIIDFGFSELAASDLLLATDLAELLASSATVVGPQRAVDAAVRAVGPETARSALSRLQLPMLSGATRTALEADPARLDELSRRITALEAR